MIYFDNVRVVENVPNKTKGSFAGSELELLVKKRKAELKKEEFDKKENRSS